MAPKIFNRRHMLQSSATAVAGTSFFVHSKSLWAYAEEKPKFTIGVCDWSLDKLGRVEALQLASQIGLEGVQVTFGEPGSGSDFREESVRAKYAAASKETGVSICSLSMLCLLGVPLAIETRAEEWVGDCIESMTKMATNPGMVLLPFFGKGDIKDNQKNRDQAVTRLKRLAPKAEKAGVTLGIESYLDAAGHRHLLDAVGSPAVKVYYDVANLAKQGYNIYEDLKQLGKDRICEIHAKEFTTLLGQGKIDFKQVYRVLNEIDWTGWLVIEDAKIKGRPTVECHKKNLKYLQSVFLEST